MGKEMSEREGRQEAGRGGGWASCLAPLLRALPTLRASLTPHSHWAAAGAGRAGLGAPIY